MNQLAAANSKEAPAAAISFLPIFVLADKPDNIIVNEPCICSLGMKQATTAYSGPIRPPIPGQTVQGNGLDSELKRAGNYATGSPHRITELP